MEGIVLYLIDYRGAVFYILVLLIFSRFWNFTYKEVGLRWLYVSFLLEVFSKFILFILAISALCYFCYRAREYLALILICPFWWFPFNKRDSDSGVFFDSNCFTELISFYLVGLTRISNRDHGTYRRWHISQVLGGLLQGFGPTPILTVRWW